MNRPTSLAKDTAQAIVNVFETGSPQGDYGKVTLIRGDSGHLTYGRSQTTLTQGGLALLVARYCDDPNALYADDLRAYLDRLDAADLTLDGDVRFHDLLKRAGSDPIMQDVQDAFFDRVYWDPSARAASGLGILEPLGVAVVYDSHVHGSWGRMRNRTSARHGSVSDIGERVWIERYIAVREGWLAASNPPLSRTTYRMRAFTSLIEDEKWDLELPIWVCGVRIDEAALMARPPFRVSAADDTERLLKLRVPPMRGSDVGVVQEALARHGFDVDVDTIFGPQTRDAVSAFQRREGLYVDGIVGPATRAALGV
ncbi:chitosanase [Candidatus Poribacteria bacterium]|nr:chitosanase [Candidatus Poribacteria bacterium]